MSRNNKNDLATLAISRMHIANISILAACLAVTISLLGQNREFEVETVKPVDINTFERIGRGCHGKDSNPQSVSVIPLGHCNFGHITVRELIGIAYDTKLSQVLGGPSWLDSSEYAIQAKAEDGGSLSEHDLLMLLRSLIRKEFRVTLHEETSVVDGFALMVAKSGVKLKSVESGTPVKARFVSSGLAGTVDLKTLVDALEAALGRPVLDRTGLHDTYVVDLRWRPQTEQRTPASIEDLPSIATALQEQAGMYIESQRVPIRMLMIDSAQKPSP